MLWCAMNEDEFLATKKVNIAEIIMTACTSSGREWVTRASGGKSIFMTTSLKLINFMSEGFTIVLHSQSFYEKAFYVQNNLLGSMEERTGSCSGMTSKVASWSCWLALKNSRGEIRDSRRLKTTSFVVKVSDILWKIQPRTNEILSLRYHQAILMSF